jgi:hypothetical protein
VTLADLLGVLLSIALSCCSFVLRPNRAQCPPSFYASGLHPSGEFTCLAAPAGDPEFDGWRGGPDATIERPWWFKSRIWCTGGAHPIVVLTDREARTVGCSR